MKKQTYDLEERLLEDGAIHVKWIGEGLTSDRPQFSRILKIIVKAGR